MEHIYQNIEGWFNFPTVYSQAVKNCPDGGYIVEVGTWLGKSASFMAVEIINSKKRINFDCIDTWKGSDEHQHNLPENLFNQFLKNTESVKHIICPIQLSSIEASQIYPDRSLDFVFLDASHKYEDIKQDLEAWWPKVAIGGYLAGHDYCGGWSGVDQAVREFFGDVQVQENCFVQQKVAGG